ncbi:MAG: hypothetical protein L0219_00425, partial [Phycisphaerales bacterium]|nr:hypothetical protein [Phycisphaerales bacterium]
MITDASGLLGVFYRSGRSGGIVASSSLALLKELDPALVATARRLGWYGMNWYPPPETKLRGVWKLLGDQIIDPGTGTVRHLDRSTSGRFAALSTDAAAVAILEALAHVLRRMAGEYRSIHLAFTAGLDSRTLLAAALHAGIKVSAVTFDLPRSSSADLQLPVEICRSVGVHHRILRPKPRVRDARKIFDDHTLGNSEDAPRVLYETNMLGWLGQGDCVLLGGCFEIGRGFYHSRFSGLDWMDVVRDPLVVAWRFRDFGSVREEARQLLRWIQWRNQHRSANDWSDMFYLDQRLCGWLSAAHQSLDLFNGEFMQAANSNYVLDLLLSRSLEERRQAAVQRRILAMLEMDDRRYPINPDTDGAMRRLL